MMSPRNQAKIRRHLKFVNNLLTNYILLIIKFIPPLGILDIGYRKACLTEKSRLEIKA